MKVRKGTHSCWECRRRKVKCTFASEEDTICVTCRRRSTKCASQTASERSNGIENNTEHGQWVVATQPFSVGGSNDQRESRDATEHSPLLSPFPISATPALALHGHSIVSLKLHPLNQHANKAQIRSLSQIKHMTDKPNRHHSCL